MSVAFSVLMLPKREEFGWEVDPTAKSLIRASKEARIYSLEKEQAIT